MAFRSVNVESLGLQAPLSHAVEVDPGSRLLFVSGLTAKSADGSTFAPGDVGGQARRILESIEEVIERAGGTMANVVKLTVFVCDMARFSEVAAARAEFFSAPYPASTMFEVSRLVSPDQLVEIEAIAALPSNSASQK